MSIGAWNGKESTTYKCYPFQQNALLYKFYIISGQNTVGIASES